MGLVGEIRGSPIRSDGRRKLGSLSPRTSGAFYRSARRAVKQDRSSGQSLRRAVIGSTRAARRAGKNDATAPAAINESATTTNVTGSPGCTPYRTLASERLSADAPVRPNASPVA